VQAWCERCAGLSEFASLRDATVLISAGADTVTHLMREGKLHFMRTPAGSVVICLPSILGHISKDEF
jgi:hypothetical protein